MIWPIDILRFSKKQGAIQEVINLWEVSMWKLKLFSEKITVPLFTVVDKLHNNTNVFIEIVAFGRNMLKMR